MDNNEQTKPNGASEKENFLSMKEREYQTTLKVLKAFPKDKLDFKPHEKSKSAGGLAFNFAQEERVNVDALKGKVDFSVYAEKAPESMDEIIALLETNHKASMDAIKAASDEQIGQMVEFAGMKLRAMDVFWFMMVDSIHHRGQFSVYIRLAGGLVPSIYGPSADEPWDEK